jgi:branched-chain amino acid transport system permease protein
VIHHLLSGDLPRSRVLAALLITIFLALALAPFYLPGTKALNVAANVCIFVVLVASYDLLLGYTGIVSFAHTMFFGIGAYGVGIALAKMGPTWTAVGTGAGAALVLSFILSLVIGLFSLRVRATFYTMITLAVGVVFQTVATQFSNLTGGDDGLTPPVPPALSPSFRFGAGQLLGATLNGRFIAYYLAFAAAVILFLAMLRIVNSPFGRVLQAIRENDFRAEALGYGVVPYRTLANVIAAAFATLAGVLLILWARYNSPSTSLSLEIMLFILLMVVLGGVGTLYGAVIGATLFIVAQSYLQDFIGIIGVSVAGLPIVGGLLAALFSPSRWLLWLGILFVVAVRFFPAGIVGELRRRT